MSSFPNAKELKKLADSCRKAGIKHFKSGDMEFTLTDDAPVSTYKKTKAKANPVDDTAEVELIETDELTQEQLLFYSVVNAAPENSEELS